MVKIKTVKELKTFHNKKLYVTNLQSTLNCIKFYRDKILNDNKESEILENLASYISLFEEEIQNIQKELTLEEPAIIETINAVKDDVSRQALKLHYCDCINWDILTDRLGKWKDDGIKAVAYRGLKNINRQYKKRGPKPKNKNANITI